MNSVGQGYCESKVVLYNLLGGGACEEAAYLEEVKRAFLSKGKRGSSPSPPFFSKGHIRENVTCGDNGHF